MMEEETVVGLQMPELVSSPRLPGHLQDLTDRARGYGGQNKSSPKSYAKAERSMNNAVARILGIRSLWLAIDMRQF